MVILSVFVLLSVVAIALVARGQADSNGRTFTETYLVALASLASIGVASIVWISIELHRHGPPSGHDRNGASPPADR